MNPNGVIITDHIKFPGLVGNRTSDLSKNLNSLVEKIEEYNEFLRDNKEFTTKFYEIGDGLSLSYRNEER